MRMTQNDLADMIASIEHWRAGPDTLAGELLPLIERHIAAGQKGAGGGEYPHEQMDAIAAERYKVLPTNAGFWPFCVKAGDGERELFKGHRNSCIAVAGQLTTAFQDGGFAATAMLASPQPPKPAGAVPMPEAVASRAPNALAKGQWVYREPGHFIEKICRQSDAIRYGDAREAAAKVWTGCTTCENWRAASWENAEKLVVAEARIYELEAAGRADAVPDGRQEFEKWAQKRHGLSVTRWDDSGEYTSHLTRNWWQCWTKSRSTIAPAPQPMTTQGEAVYLVQHKDTTVKSNWTELTKDSYEGGCFPDELFRRRELYTGPQP